MFASYLSIERKWFPEIYVIILTDSSRAPGLTSGLQGSVNVHRGALLLVPQWQCISSCCILHLWIQIISTISSSTLIYHLQKLYFPIRKWKVGCPLKQWAAQWTGAAHCLCKLIIISAHGLHMGSSVGRSCPLTSNLIIISDHGLPMGSSDC